MQVGISSAVFYPMETEHAIDRIIELGFNRVELFLNCESEYEDSFTEKIKARMDDAGVRVVSVHPYTSLIEGMFFFSEYERRTLDSINIYRKYFKAAQRLGAKYFTFHGNRRVTGTVNAVIDMERQCRAIESLAGVASEYGILLTQENVSWCDSANCEYLKILSDELGGKIGFTLDLKQARRANVPIEDYINVMGNNLKNIHISDHSHEEVCLLPGNGELDHDDFLDKLTAAGYFGDVIIEVYSSNYAEISQIKDAKNMLERKILQKNM